jgi:hypothetical protein
LARDNLKQQTAAVREPSPPKNNTKKPTETPTNNTPNIPTYSMNDCKPSATKKLKYTGQVFEYNPKGSVCTESSKYNDETLETDPTSGMNETLLQTRERNSDSLMGSNMDSFLDFLKADDIQASSLRKEEKCLPPDKVMQDIVDTLLDEES